MRAPSERRAGLRQLDAGALTNAAAGDFEADGGAFAGLWRQAIDQRLLAVGEAGAAAR
jgi:hypothetical protein